MHELLGLGGITVSNFKKGTKKGTENRPEKGNEKKLMLLNRGPAPQLTRYLFSLGLKSEPSNVQSDVLSLIMRMMANNTQGQKRRNSALLFAAALARNMCA